MQCCNAGGEVAIAVTAVAAVARCGRLGFPKRCPCGVLSIVKVKVANRSGKHLLVLCYGCCCCRRCAMLQITLAKLQFMVRHRSSLLQAFIAHTPMCHVLCRKACACVCVCVFGASCFKADLTADYQSFKVPAGASIVSS